MEYTIMMNIRIFLAEFPRKLENISDLAEWFIPVKKGNLRFQDEINKVLMFGGDATFNLTDLSLICSMYREKMIIHISSFLCSWS
jgi:hypothetical protein